MKLIYIAAFISLVFVAYLGGFISGVKRYFPFSIAQQMYTHLKNPTEEVLGWNTCEIENLFELPSVFSVLIGHAYGAPSKSKLDGFIAPNVERFLLKNNSKILNIIFTGDIFSVPSSSKWENLFKKFAPTKIYIAPGNHDILRPDSKEVFAKIKDIKKNFPFALPVQDNISLVIDDSISSSWRAGKKLKLFIKSITTESIFVARHNMPISQLLPYANSMAGNPGIPSVSDFIEDFSKKQNFTWIMGDGGAFESLPRITCHSFENHRFIVNGIGEVENDIVLILHEGKIFSHIIQ
jgi:hypothetical protein